MATVSRSRAITRLVGQEPLAFIREQQILCQYSDARPNTELNVFINGTPSNNLIRPNIPNPNPNAADQWMPVPWVAPAPLPRLKSTATGEVSFQLFIPKGQFRAGELDLIVTEAAQIEELDVLGNNLGKAEGTFVAEGVLHVYRKTISQLDIDLRVPPPPPPPNVDPLAQQFFTYGKRGGVFVTAIELFFYSKDLNIPASVEIREMVNGYPGPNLVSPDAHVTLPPQLISTSEDALTPTKFTFPIPIYLPENGEYCFVTKSTVNSYQIWSSKMGEKQKETGKIIFEQPYTGQMFKSQNNSTWTTDQFEDCKFNLYIAKFDAPGGTIKLVGNAPHRWVKGSEGFTTTAGSNRVIYKGHELHGFTGVSNEKVHLVPVAPSGVYNGISAANLTGDLPLTRIIDPYTFEFEINQLASTSGPISSSNVIHYIHIENPGGSGNAPRAITIPQQNGGGQATAKLMLAVSNSFGAEVIASAEIVSAGSGYTSNVPCTLWANSDATGMNGTGVYSGSYVATGITDAWFRVSTNKPLSLFVPNVNYSVPVGADLKPTHNITGLDGNRTTSIPTDLKSANFSPIEAIIPNNVNGGTAGDGFQMTFDMFRDASQTNVSPVLDLRSGASVMAYSNAINAQAFNESNLLSALSSSTVSHVIVTASGSGYTTVPAVTITPAENETNTANITSAAGTAVMLDGAITDVIITQIGAGFTKPPIVTIASPGQAGQAASAHAILTSPVNSELLPKLGQATSRYLTKQITLETMSNGVKLIANIASTVNTSVDWYIRTSKQGDSSVHTEKEWYKLNCDVARNKSANLGIFYDYEFYLYDMPSDFDVYDLKCVFSATKTNITPVVKNYRVIVVI